MSGIVGIYHRDGHCVDSQEIKTMLEQILYRGPDGIATWCQRELGLGHCMLWTTPESLFESLPCVDPATQLVITSDARIDNRPEMISRLGLTETASDPVADSQILLAAYRRWGVETPGQIVGDFSFSIWDPTEKTLFCARDPMGVKPFYYYCSPVLFCFASELQALLSLESIPSRLNPKEIAIALTGVQAIIRAMEGATAETVYQDLYALPPAHWLKVTPEALEIRRYWQLDPEVELQLRSREEYTEAFSELFSQAVHCRLRSAYPLGIQLSGGLDSSSVAGVARRVLPEGQLLSTFSARFPSLPPRESRLVDEQRYVRALVSGGSFTPHWLEADRLSPLRDGDRIWQHPDGFVFASNLYLTRGLFHQARSTGVRVMLGGLDGDTTLSHGLAYLKRLAFEGKWIELARQMGVARTFQENPWEMYWSYLWRYGLRRGPIRRLWQWLAPSQPDRSLLNPELMSSLGLGTLLREATQSYQESALSERQMHYRSITSGMQQVALCNFDLTAARHGVEARHPFFDRRLLEFCLALPIDQKLWRGWSRIILRRAMQGILPEQIQWRQTKANLSSSFDRGLICYEKELIEQMLQHRSDLDAYLNLTVLEQAHQRYRLAFEKNDFTERGTDHQATIIWRVLQFWIWRTRFTCC